MGALDTQADTIYCLRLRVFVDYSFDEGPLAELHHELCGAVDSPDGAFRIHPAFEPMGGIRCQTQCFRSFSNTYRVEISAFNQHPAGGIFNFRVQTAHNAAHGDRLFPVADHQHLVVERTLFLIQGDKLITISGGFNHNSILCQLIKIKSVQGLAGFH